MRDHRLQNYLIALNLLLYFVYIKCNGEDTLKIDTVVLNMKAEDICLAADTRASALQQLRESVNDMLFNHIAPPVTPKTDVTSRVPTTAMPVLNQSELFGGPGGGPFDDYDHHNSSISGIIGMNISADGKGIVYIQVNYRLNNGSTFLTEVHGRAGRGTIRSFALADGERLTRMEGTYTSGILQIKEDPIIEKLTFYSNRNNKTYGPYGNINSNSNMSFYVESTEIVALFGRAGWYVDAIGAYYII